MKKLLLLLLLVVPMLGSVKFEYEADLLHEFQSPCLAYDQKKTLITLAAVWVNQTIEQFEAGRIRLSKKDVEYISAISYMIIEIQNDCIELQFQTIFSP